MRVRMLANEKEKKWLVTLKDKHHHHQKVHAVAVHSSWLQFAIVSPSVSGDDQGVCGLAVRAVTDVINK